MNVTIQNFQRSTHPHQKHRLIFHILKQGLMQLPIIILKFTGISKLSFGNSDTPLYIPLLLIIIQTKGKLYLMKFKNNNY